MTRNLKLLGVCLAAVFAVSAAMASAAMAQQGMLTSDGAVKLKTTETGAAAANQLEAFGGHTRCPGTNFTGWELEETPHEFIEPPVSAITVSADYGTCTTELNGSQFPTTIDMTSCDFEFEVGNTNGTDSYAVTGGVKCDVPGDHIDITLFSSAEHKLKLCTIVIDAAESGIGGGTVTNTTASDDLDLTGTFATFTATKSGLCGSQTDTAAKLAVDATVTGWNEGGTETGITITDS